MKSLIGIIKTFFKTTTTKDISTLAIEPTFDKLYLFDDYHLGIYEMFKGCVQTEKNLKLTVTTSEAKKSYTIFVSVQKNTKFDLGLFRTKMEAKFDVIRFDTHKSTGSLSSTYGQRELAEKSTAEKIKAEFNLKGKIYEVPYEEGDDWNFVSETPNHWNLTYDTNCINIQIRKNRK